MNRSYEKPPARSGVGHVVGRFHDLDFVVTSTTPVIASFRHTRGGKSWSETWHDPVQKVPIAFILPLKKGYLSFKRNELVGKNPPVQDFLEDGGGLHRVCYETDDLDRATCDDRSQGSVLVRRPQPAVAFSGRRIAWFISRQKKLLVKLFEEIC